MVRFGSPQKRISQLAKLLQYSFSGKFNLLCWFPVFYNRLLWNPVSLEFLLNPTFHLQNNDIYTSTCWVMVIYLLKLVFVQAGRNSDLSWKIDSKSCEKISPCPSWWLSDPLWCILRVSHSWGNHAPCLSCVLFECNNLQNICPTRVLSNYLGCL